MTTPAMNFSPMTKFEPPAIGAAGRRRGHGRERAGARAPAAQPPQQQTSSARQQQTEQRPRNGKPNARESVLRLLPADCGDRAQRRHPRRQARLYRDRGNALAVRSIGRALGRDLLHRLCRQERRGREPSHHLRVQRRAGRGVGLSEFGLGRAADPRVRRQRSRRRPPAGQSADLARLHRSGHDRSGRNRLEQAGQGRRRRRILRRARDAQALAKTIALYLAKNGRGNSPKYILGRKLRRVSRRQGGAGAAARAGHHGVRHRHGVAVDRGRP